MVGIGLEILDLTGIVMVNATPPAFTLDRYAIYQAPYGMEYETGKQVLDDLFGGNASRAARETPFSRQTWQSWKGKPISTRLELWLLKRSQASADTPAAAGVPSAP